MDRSRRRSGSQPAGLTTPGDPGPRPDSGQPTVYQVRVKGNLEDRLCDGHEGLVVTLEEGGHTLLTVPVVDQAALHGLLRRLRDLAVPLVSINPAGRDQMRSPRRKENR